MIVVDKQLSPRELKYQCSKCLNYKKENEFSKNKCYIRGVNYLCKQYN